jgi:maleylpyruvate isomerase
MGGVPLTGIDVDRELARVAASTDRLLETLRAQLTDPIVSEPSFLPAATWEQSVVDVSGAVRPARVMPARRWKEVEIHHVDLDLGYRPRDWPTQFVDAQLEYAVGALPGRLVAGTSVGIVPTDRDTSWSVGSGSPASGAVSASAAELLAWLIGRPSSVTGGPVLEPWE